MGIKPVVSTITVAAAGTRGVVVAVSKTAISVYFEALTTNAGTIYVGDSTVSSTKYSSALAAGAGFGISTDAQGRVGGELQLNTFYVDCSNSGDKVQMTYLERTGSN